MCCGLFLVKDLKYISRNTDRIPLCLFAITMVCSYVKPFTIAFFSYAAVTLHADDVLVKLCYCSKGISATLKGP